MAPNPFLGVFFHWLGGLASASFYLPYRGVKKWSWETYWLVGGFFSWIIAPAFLAWLLVPNAFGVLRETLSSTPGHPIWWAYFWGAMWGFGGLTFGLTMRYLGIGLGMAVALSYCTVFGTLMPQIAAWLLPNLVGGTSIVEVATRNPGQVVLLGVLITVIGIVVTGQAGMSKEKELDDEAKKTAVKEFNFWKGILVATFSGIMSASFNYGQTAGTPIGDIALKHLTAAHPQDIAFWSMFQKLPILIVVLWGGFTTNFLWCLFLNVKNKSGLEYFKGTKVEVVEIGGDAPAAPPMDSHGSVMTASRTATKVATREMVVAVPMLTNYIFSAIAGVTWYMQFFFYSMGTTKMGKYDFSSWTLHMASIIIFSSIWGLTLKEWDGTSKKTKNLVLAGILILVFATVVVGFGNYMDTWPQYAKAAATASGH